MTDNVGINASLDPAAPKAATDEVPYSGDNAQVQLIQLGFVTGAEGSKTLVKAPGDGTTGFLVNSAGPLLTSLDGKLPAAAALADTTANPTLSKVGAFPYLFNGTTWDREYANRSLLLLALAARTVTISATLTNHNSRGAIFTFYVSVAGAGSLQFSVVAVDTLGNQFVLLSPAAVTTTGLYVYVVYPGAVLAGGITTVLSAPLARAGGVVVSPSGASSWTYGVGCELIR